MSFKLMTHQQRRVDFCRRPPGSADTPVVGWGYRGTTGMKQDKTQINADKKKMNADK
jgi:hypothetical protein